MAEATRIRENGGQRKDPPKQHTKNTLLPLSPSGRRTPTPEERNFPFRLTLVDDPTGGHDIEFAAERRFMDFHPAGYLVVPTSAAGF